MSRWLRRSMFIVVITSMAGGYVIRRRRPVAVRPSGPQALPSWPPFASTATPASQTEPVLAADASTLWVPPTDGECPAGYPVKANDKSGIFHVPGGRFYNRTIPERCYADAAHAAADGYRAAKA